MRTTRRTTTVRSSTTHYRRAIAIDPEHADAHCNLDIFLEKRKGAAEALLVLID